MQRALIVTVLVVLAAATAGLQPRGPIAAHFHHVHVNSTDPAKTSQFYASTFGAQPVKYKDKTDALFVSRGETLSKLLGLDRLLRLKVLPISIALPWGINVGDFLGHIPLPAKITVEALPPIRLREEFGAEPDVDEAYEHVVRVMQETLDALAAERRLPLIG